MKLPVIAFASAFSFLVVPACTSTSAKSSLDKLCSLAQEVQAEGKHPPSSKGSELAKRCIDSSTSKNAGLLKAFNTSATLPPGEKSDPIFQYAEQEGLKDWKCPALIKVLDGKKPGTAPKTVN